MNKDIRITMVMVMSLDGIISRAETESVSVWSSTEDKLFFNKMIEKSDGVITGRKSFKKHLIRPGKFYYVLTNNKQLKSDSSVRYVSGSIDEILDLAKKDNVKNLLLLGGAQTNYVFLKENAVDDLFLTVEPHMFGTGKHLNICEKLNINLELLSSEIINKMGTLHLHYKILKNK